MKEILIGKNDNQQRADRFLKKYFSKASSSFIYKMIRKKRIKLNNSRFNPDDMLVEGDKLQVYFSDETIEKFISPEEVPDVEGDLDIIYEDENIIIIDKPVGLLTHSSDKNYSEGDVVSRMVSYLYKKKEYVPRIEKSFTPSVCNRLDRNTSGLIIGAKNYESLKAINEAIRNRKIDKYYKTIVKGKIIDKMVLTGGLHKDLDENKVYVSDNVKNDDKEIITEINPIRYNDRYTELEIKLVTGRTHQIRAHLSHEKHPVLGDRKYGDRNENSYFRNRYGLENQLLHAYKIVFDGFSENLRYLNGKIFISESKSLYKKIEENIFQ